MSLLFDQNLSHWLPALLSAEFPRSEHVIAAGLATADDRAVWAYAAAQGLAVVSKDADFAQLSAAGSATESHLLRVGDGPTRDVVTLLRTRAADVQAFLADPVAARPGIALAAHGRLGRLGTFKVSKPNHPLQQTGPAARHFET